MADSSVLIDVECKCPKCEHKYLTKVRFTRKSLLMMLRVLRQGEVKQRKAKLEGIKKIGGTEQINKCSSPNCDKEATKIFKTRNRDVPVCDEHYKDLADFQSNVVLAQTHRAKKMEMVKK